MRCLVVGSSKGIGREIVRGLTAHGDRVHGVSRTPADPSDRGGWSKLDLTGSDGAISEQVAHALYRLDGLDLLVLSGGMGAMHTPFEETDSHARELMQTNFLGPIAVWRACTRELLRSHGTAIFIGSTCANRPSPGLTLYRASKAALHAFALNQAHVYRDRIRVHVLAPGWVDTEMTADLKPALKEKIVSRIPAGRFATVEDVAGAFFMLLDQKDASIYEVREDGYFTTEQLHGR